MGETQVKLRLGGNGFQDRERNALADDRGGLEQALLCWWETVDSRSEDRLDRGRHGNARVHSRRTIGTRLTDQYTGLDQRPDALLQKERIPLGPLDEELPERLELRIFTEEGVQQLFGRLGGKGAERELGVVGIAAPAVVVLGTIIDQGRSRAVGRLSTRLSSSAWVSASIQWRSSTIRQRDCT